MRHLSDINRHDLALALAMSAAASLAAPLQAADVALYGLTKTHLLVQAAPPPAGVTSRPGEPFVFEAFVQGTGSSPIDSVLLTIPGGLAGSPVPGDGLTYFIKPAFATGPTMESAYPAGTYRLEIDSLDDGYTPIQLTMATAAYPPDPRIANYTDAQSVDPSAPFTIQWEPFAGAGTEDFIEVTLFDSAGFEIFVDTGLTGTNLSLTLPANTLRPNESFEIELGFVNVASFDFNSYPGAVGYTAFRKTTLAPILTTAGSVSPSDVSFYAVLKWEHYAQTTSGAPVLESANSREFSTIVRGKTAGSVTAASVTTPLGTLLPLSPDLPEWVYDAPFNTVAELDASFPSGLYALSIDAVTNGLRSLFLVLAGDTYPNAPRLSNFDAAQSIPAAAPFNLLWEPFAGATATDYIRLEVLDSQNNQVVQTGNPGEATALPGTATSFTIPASTLQQGATYTATLLFADVLSETNAYPGALGLSGYARSTTFTIRTTDNGSAPPSLTDVAIVPGTPPRLQFTVNGTAGRPHRVDAGESPESWTPILTNTPTSSTFPFTTDITTPPSRRFYRVVLLP